MEKMSTGKRPAEDNAPRRSERKVQFQYHSGMKGWDENRVLLLPNHASASLVDNFTKMFASASFHDSMTEGVVDKSDRDSKTAVVSLETNSKLFLFVNEVVQTYTGYNISHVEPVQLVEYDEEGKFELHQDAASMKLDAANEAGGDGVQQPQMSDGLPQLEMSAEDKKNPRVATIICYLNKCQGGALFFPYLSDKGTSYGTKGTLYGPPQSKSQAGLRIHPDKGTVVVFKNLLPESGEADPRTVHRAEEVKSGIKRAIQIWVCRHPLQEDL